MKKNKIIHLQTGCFLTEYFRIPYYKIQTTTSIEKVTCRQCLKKINRLGLRERKDFPTIPTFAAKANRRCWYFTCPVCGAENAHGIGPGHRVSHCDCWSPGGYELVLAGGEPKKAYKGK